MELERERSSRAKAERLAETWAAKADAARREAAAAVEANQHKLDAAHERTLQLQAQLAVAAEELVVARALAASAEHAAQLQATAANAAREHATALQQSLERLTTAMEASAASPAKSGVRRKRSVPAAP
jgi:hypothetical protein